MKTRLAFHLPLVLTLLAPACQNALSYSTSAFNGQVLLISYPGPQPAEWTPPPLQEVSVVLVLNAHKNIVKEVTTDVTGHFHISLAPSTYYLRVKYSPIPVDAGPYVLQAGRVLAVEAYFDTAMR